MRINHILSHKNNSWEGEVKGMSNLPPIHPKQAQVLQQIRRTISPTTFNQTPNSQSSTTNPNSFSPKHPSPSSQPIYNPQYQYTSAPTANQFKYTLQNILQSSPINPPPQIDIIRTTLTRIDKVMSSNHQAWNSSNSSLPRQIIEEEVYQYSPTVDQGLQEQQLDENGWPVQSDQFFQGQRQSQQLQNAGMPPNPMGVMFSQMIAQGAANGQMNQVNHMMNSNNSMNLMNIGVPLPGMANHMMDQMNPAQNFMNGPGQNHNPGFNFVQDMMPVPMLQPEPVYDYNQMGMAGNQGPLSQNPMRMSQNDMNNSFNFSQASSPAPPFNFNMNPNPNPNPNLMQSSVHPAGLAEQLFQQMPPGPPMQPPLPGVTGPMMNLAGSLSNMFQQPNEVPNRMGFSQTRPLQHPNSTHNQAQGINQNFANSLNDLMNQGNQQRVEEQNYTYHRPAVELITCVICKETYDINNTRDHVLRHKSFKLPPKNELLQAALKASIPKPKLVIPKRPTIRPIVEPQECILKPQGNTYVYEKIHKLQGQELQIIDDFGGPDPRLSQIHRSSLSNRMAPLIAGTDTPDPNFFPNYYNQDAYIPNQGYESQIQPFPGGGMMNSQVRNSHMMNPNLMDPNMMMDPQIRNSAYNAQSSELSDFSYNYLGDQIPTPPQTGVIAAQKMRVPRQVLAAWRG